MRGVILLFGFFICAAASGENKTVDRSKRSFYNLGCIGAYDKNKFVRLFDLCEDCLELFREPDIEALCKSFCFKNSYFPLCIDALLMNDEKAELDAMVEEINIPHEEYFSFLKEIPDE